MKRKVILIFILLIISLFACKESLIISEKKENRKVIEKYAKQYESKNWEERIEAIQNISKYSNSTDTDIVKKILIQATYDIHLSVRVEALKGLAGLPSINAMARIVKLATTEDNDNVRWYALHALAYYRDSTSAPIFIIGLKSKDWLIREISIKGILMINDLSEKYKMIPYIVKAIKDPNNSVKITTLKYLDIKDDKIYNEIIKIFNKHIDSGNTQFKASLMAMRGYKLDEKTREKVINLLTHENREIRILALRILKEEKITLKLK